MQRHYRPAEEQVRVSKSAEASQNRVFWSYPPSTGPLCPQPMASVQVSASGCVSGVSSGGDGGGVIAFAHRYRCRRLVASAVAAMVESLCESTIQIRNTLGMLKFFFSASVPRALHRRTRASLGIDVSALVRMKQQSSRKSRIPRRYDSAITTETEGVHI